MENQVLLHLSTYKRLISKLKGLKLDDMAEHLQRSVINNFVNNNHEDERPDSPTTENSDCISLETSDDDSSREDNFHTKLQVVKEPLSINVKKATKFRDRPELSPNGAYPMRSNPRGMALIIANNLYKIQKDRRPSAKHDEANLKRLFEDMGFKVIPYFDLTGEEIEKRVEEFSKMPELRRVDSAFVVISSHGSGKLGRQETEILGVDYNATGYKKVVCTTIMNHFTAEHCRSLSGKPKIFIFQTCRGKNEQNAVPRYTIDAATSSRPRVEDRYVQFSETMRNFEDMLIVYSTIPGYVSYRDEYNGSWFIQILCEVFMNYAHKMHVRDLFDMIDNRLKYIRTLDDNCQTPSITSQGFNKLCFLNPGLFEDKQLLNGSLKSKSSEISEADVTFKCCPDRKANIYICSQCDAIYHNKCAQKLNNVKPTGKIKAICCSSSENGDNAEEVDNKSLSVNVGELKKVLSDLKEENYNLKEQISALDIQHENIISDEISMKNFEQNLKVENLANEIELLKQLNSEITEKNVLLKEKIEWLTDKLNKKKKNKWVKRNLRKCLKRRKANTPMNAVEPVEI